MRHLLPLALTSCATVVGVPDSEPPVCVDKITQCHTDIEVPSWAGWLPIEFALSPAAEREWGTEFREAIAWWDRSIHAYDAGLQPEVFVVLGPEDPDAPRARVHVEVRKILPWQAGIAIRSWTDGCLLRSGQILFQPGQAPEWRWAIAVHEIGHMIGLEHRLNSQVMHCRPQQCGLDRSCHPSEDELRRAHLGVAGW